MSAKWNLKTESEKSQAFLVLEETGNQKVRKVKHPLYWKTESKEESSILCDRWNLKPDSIKSVKRQAVNSAEMKTQNTKQKDGKWMVKG